MPATNRISLLLFFLFCSHLLFAQERDTLMYPRDSAIDLLNNKTGLFFQTGEKIADPSTITIVTAARKTQNLKVLLTSNQKGYSDHVLSDLDNDGKKELLIGNFNASSGSPDELWIYKNSSANKYQYTAKLVAGRTEIGPEKLFVYHFQEQLGRFYSCDVCGYSDTSDAAPIPLKDVTVRYVTGKLSVVKGDQELRSAINDNLGKLGERLTPLSPTGEDDGTRKEFAMNLAVYYYSFGKNLASTKTLFNKYYKATDARKFWVAFTKQLRLIGSQVSF